MRYKQRENGLSVLLLRNEYKNTPAPTYSQKSVKRIFLDTIFCTTKKNQTEQTTSECSIQNLLKFQFSIDRRDGMIAGGKKLLKKNVCSSEVEI